MPVNVHFRGIMLFCCKGGNLEKVLLPDGQEIPKEGEKVGDVMYHLDRVEARPHWQGIFVPATQTHYVFQNKQVVISNGTSTPLPCTAFGNVARLNDRVWMLDPGSATHPRHERSEVTIKGASAITTEYVHDRKFTFGAKEVHDRVKAEFPRSIDITIDGGTPIPVDDGDVYVYNFDEEKPSVGDLSDGEKTDWDVVVDDDFKWLYSLVTPRSGKTRIESTNRRLSAPECVSPGGTFSSSRNSVVVLTAKSAIFVSTCFPAVINED